MACSVLARIAEADVRVLATAAGHDMICLGGSSRVFVLAGALVEENRVGVTAPGHGDVGQCAGGGFAQDGVAGVGGDALGGVHGDGVAVGDVLAE